MCGYVNGRILTLNFSPKMITRASKWISNAPNLIPNEEEKQNLEIATFSWPSM